MSLQEPWNRFLSASGCGTIAHAAPDHGDERGLRAARDGAFLCSLSTYALCAAIGPDAETFLHGQLSSDVKALAATRSQLAAYNTPKGRMLATLLLWRIPDGFLLQLPASIAGALIKRLSMFVLRAKLKITDVSAQYVKLGVGGPQGAQVLVDCGIPLPERDCDVLPASATANGGTRQVLRLPGHRYELVYSDVAAAQRDWTALAAKATVAADAPWRWLGVRSGIAEIEADTQDKYVPQMLNLELVGGVSFTKGCYPGQEIVARTQYRGEIKRRTFLAHVDAAAAPALGQDIAAAGQTVGSVAAVAPAPGGGYDILACLHLDLAHNAALHLGAPAGPRLELQPLPYSLPQAI